MTVNLQTNNIVIMCYPQGFGGKTILNCLGLSKNFVLQSKELAEQQLQGQLSPTQKHELLINRLKETYYWNDLELGCFQLFYDTTYGPRTDAFEFYPVIEELSNSTTKFGLITHQYFHLFAQLEAWENANVIFLINGDAFTQSVGRDIVAVSEKQLQIEEGVRNLVSTTNNTMIWNCDWFLNETDFLSNIEKLYSKLNLPDFNSELILSFYHEWMTCLQRCLQRSKE